ncbi:MAG: hypothetical protein Roseis2KO_32430 [Roseivirga sp.]
MVYFYAKDSQLNKPDIHMKRRLFFLPILLVSFLTHAQELVLKPEFLNVEFEKATSDKILSTLEELIKQTTGNQIDTKLLTAHSQALTISTLRNFQAYEANKIAQPKVKTDKQLINFYQIDQEQYLLSVAYVTIDNDNNPVVLFVLNLIAHLENEKVTFATPLEYHTRYWQSTTVGNVTYHHRGKLNMARAKAFDKKNTWIANKLKQQPEKLDFYMCDNRQEILKLQGFDYSIQVNGDARNGHGVDANTIFSVMNNEDFSHDMFHYYSGRIHQRINRNWITEEGIAYLWGNAYYTDKDGEMITHPRLVQELNTYLAANPETNLVELFTENVKIFNHIAPEISVRSTISGVIAKEVEKQKGMDGIFTLINCGRLDRENKYFQTIEELLGINRENFNNKVGQLLADY